MTQHKFLILSTSTEFKIFLYYYLLLCIAIYPGGQADKPGGEAPKEGSHEELPQIDLSAMSAQFAQFAEAASKSSSGAQPAADFMQCIDETMKQLGQNNEQLQVFYFIVKNLILVISNISMNNFN